MAISLAQPRPLSAKHKTPLPLFAHNGKKSRRSRTKNSSPISRKRPPAVLTIVIAIRKAPSRKASRAPRTVWTGTQRPFAVRDDLAAVFHIPESSVRAIVPDTGSAYGGKHTSDAALEAARLSRAAGHPVKIVWTREEEFTWAYFRPAGVIEVKSGIATDGSLTAWEFHNYHSGSSGIETPYDVSNQRTEYHSVPLVLRTGSYRGLAATANHFARETHMDALAHSVNIDPLEFRLKNLEDARLRAVLEAAAKTFDW